MLKVHIALLIVLGFTTIALVESELLRCRNFCLPGCCHHRCHHPYRCMRAPHFGKRCRCRRVGHKGHIGGSKHVYSRTEIYY